MAQKVKATELIDSVTKALNDMTNALMEEKIRAEQMLAKLQTLTQPAARQAFLESWLAQHVKDVTEGAEYAVQLRNVWNQAMDKIIGLALLPVAVKVGGLGLAVGAIFGFLIGVIVG